MAFRVFSDPVAELVLWSVIGAIAIAVGGYVLGKIRAESAQKEPSASELLSKFRDLRSRGELTEEEFRTIKTTLAARFQEELDELRGNDETG